MGIEWSENTNLLNPFDFDRNCAGLSQETAQPGIDDLSDIFDFDTYFSSSSLEIGQQIMEEPHLEIESATEETQEHLAEDTQPTENALSPTSDEAAPKLNPPPWTALNFVTQESLEQEEKKEDELLSLRYKLQRVLLPEAGQPEANKMEAMSSRMGRLECMATPSRSAMKATSIHKLLKKIKNLDDIPEHDKFSLKERAATLLKKWKMSLGKEYPTTPLAAQRASNRSMELDVIPDGQDPANSLEAKQPTNNKTEVSVTGLTEVCPPEIVDELKVLHNFTGDYSIDPGGGSANEHSPSSKVIAAQHSSKSTPEPRLIDRMDYDVIDLVESDEADMAAIVEPGVVNAAQKTRSPLPADAGRTISCKPLKDMTGLPFSTSRSKTKKRKCSEVSNDQTFLVSSSDADRSDKCRPDNLQSSTATRSIGKGTPTHHRKLRKTSPRQHLSNEIWWMSESVPKIEKIIENVAREIDLIAEKRVRLLKENTEEMESAMCRADELVGLKMYLLAWGAQDEKATEEWTPS